MYGDGHGQTGVAAATRENEDRDCGSPGSVPWPSWSSSGSASSRRGSLRASRADWWAIDLDLVLDAGRRLVAGEPLYADPKFLYPPLAAVVADAIPGVRCLRRQHRLRGGKLALAAGGVRCSPGRWSWGPRPGVPGLVFSLPFLHDVFLGNATSCWSPRWRSRRSGLPVARSGIALGVAAAIFAKPLVVPFLLWLLVCRRSVFWGTVAAGVAATAIGMLVAGLPAYLAWIDGLVAGGQYAAPFEGNHGVTALVPGAWPLVAAVTAAGLVFVLLRRGPGSRYVWAVTSGILLAPLCGYLRGAAGCRRHAGPAVWPHLGSRSVILAVSPIATTHPLPVYAVVILLGALASGSGCRCSHRCRRSPLKLLARASPSDGAIGTREPRRAAA